MALTPISIKPGIYRNETQYRAEGSWWDCDKVRFREGQPEMIGGWVAKNTALPAGAGSIRSMFSFYARSSGGVAATPNFMIGADYDFLKGKLYDGSTSTTLTSIKPSATTAVALGNNPFTEQSGGNLSVYLTVTEVNHKKRPGDTVTFAGATGFDTILAATLNSAFIVSEVYKDYYLVYRTDGVTYPGGSNSGGGSGVTVTTSFTTDTAYSTKRLWSQHEYGDNLIVCDGRALYYWDPYGTSSVLFYMDEASPTYGIRESGITNPTANKVPVLAGGVTVGKDRAVIALRCNDFTTPWLSDPLLVRWSDQENPFDWEDREDNTAGSFHLEGGSQIVSWMSTKREILIWTDTSLFSMKWVGAPFYYGFDKIADNISIASQNAAVAIGDVVLWMGKKGEFYSYNGQVSRVPCTVSRYVSASLYSDISLACAGYVAEFGEAWWYYPTTTAENSNYVQFSTLERGPQGDPVWAIGTMARSATLTVGNKVLFAGAGTVYLHEYGYGDVDINGTASNILAYIESGDFDLGEGDHYMFATRLFADHGMIGANGTLIYEFKGRDSALNTLYPLQKVFVATPQSRNDIRFRARQATLKLSSNAADCKWNLGKPRLDLQPDGMR